MRHEHDYVVNMEEARIQGPRLNPTPEAEWNRKQRRAARSEARKTKKRKKTSHHK